MKKDAATPDLLRLMVEGPKTKQPVDILVDKNNPNMAKQIMVDGKTLCWDLVLKFYKPHSP